MLMESLSKLDPEIMTTAFFCLRAKSSVFSETSSMSCSLTVCLLAEFCIE